MFENMESLKRRKRGLKTTAKTESKDYCKNGTFFPAKEGVHSRNTFGTLAQKKGNIFPWPLNGNL
jgi:hypothetical protein